MKNRIVLSVLAASLLVVLSAALAHAGSTARMNATIPFAFTVGSVSFPSGDYTISETSMAGILLIQNRRENIANYVSTFAGRSSGQYGGWRIMFNRYGDQYFLSQVSYGIEGDSRKLSLSQLEKDFIGVAHAAAQNSRRPEVVVVGTL